jgi:hypothetical protein
MSRDQLVGRATSKPELHHYQDPLRTSDVSVEKSPILTPSIASHDVWVPKGIDDVAVVAGQIRMTVEEVLPFAHRDFHDIAAS